MAMDRNENVHAFDAAVRHVVRNHSRNKTPQVNPVLAEAVRAMFGPGEFNELHLSGTQLLCKRPPQDGSGVPRYSFIADLSEEQADCIRKVLEDK